jgi:hypothetical protein
VSVDLEENDKKAKWALGCGGLMTVAFLIAGVALWSLPAATAGRVDGRALGLPFTGVGSIFLAAFGGLIAGIGWLALKRGRRGRAPVPPWRKPPGPPRREHAEAG